MKKSILPDTDFVINPYVGCSHACKYCYACFMKRFTGHSEKWETFVDVKKCDKSISLEKIKGKKVFLSSVTDCYNEMEKEYRITREILNQLKKSDAYVSISTKSSLILRDLDVLKQMKNIKVSMSINTLHENGIYTVLFMSPIFPEITEWREIIEDSKNFVDEFWFENLNLCGQYKSEIMNYIIKKYSNLSALYFDIYENKNEKYWDELAFEINEFCEKNELKYVNYFYHKMLVEKNAWVCDSLILKLSACIIC